MHINVSSFLTNVYTYCHSNCSGLTACAVRRLSLTLSSMAERGKKQRPGKVKLRHIEYIERLGGESSMPPPGIIDINVMGSGAAGTPRGIFVDFSHFRYMFNCSESSQRVATESRMKISKLKNVFVTHKSWDNIGGMLGMALSLEAIGLPEITLHGPPKIEEMVTMSRGFSPLMDIKIHKREVSEETYEDSAMKIDYIPIFPKSESGESETANNGRSPATKRRRLYRDDDMSVIYLCQPVPKQPRMDLEKAVDLGIPRGKLLGQLKGGESVTLEDGRVINPEDVLSTPEPNNPFMVLEVPDSSYLESLLENEKMNAIRARQGEDALQLLVHYTPSHVLDLSSYKEWMNGFSAGTKHLVINSSGSPVAQIAPYELQTWLNLVHPQIFPLLHEQTLPKEDLLDLESQNVVHGRSCLRYSIRAGNGTRRGFFFDQCYQLDNAKFLSTPDVVPITGVDQIQPSLDELKTKLTGLINSGPINQDFPDVVFLGTGSSIPNKIRNVSAILIHTREDNCIFLDCGEGTYSQLCHFYGDKTDSVLRKLGAIFISHLHADHHMGLIGLVQAREKALRSAGLPTIPLPVIVAKSLDKFIDSTDKHLLPLSDKIKLVPIEWFVHPDYIVEKKPDCLKVIKSLRFSKMEFVKMFHPQYPYGIAITHEDGWKIAYSGDTMPCDAFVEIGKNCDILIHEATMEDDLIEDARNKRHSTTSQAIDIGMRMKAKFILLTHFSQRYAKLPRFNSKFSDRVGIAFDNMRVRPQDLAVLPLLTPVLQAMFQEVLDEMEKRTQKHLQNQETKKQLEVLEEMSRKDPS